MSPTSSLIESAAHRLDERLLQLAAVTDDPQGATLRTFLSPAMQTAGATVGRWFAAAGLQVMTDRWGNLRGRKSFPPEEPSKRVLLIGSHLDTVPNAGRFDGPLGVLLGLAAVEVLNEQPDLELPFDLEVIGFSDEEGVRFQVPYLGSRAFTGGIEKADLESRDARQITLNDAVRSEGGPPVSLPSPAYATSEVLGYVEVHLEQGPLLEKENLALGLVEGVAAQSRLQVVWEGKASHAGTTPMHLRRDALAGAAECLVALERLARETPQLVITAGQLEVRPGASNVIPQEVWFTLDVRQPESQANALLIHQTIPSLMQEIASRRLLFARPKVVREIPGVRFSSKLTALLERAVLKVQDSAPLLLSGAGHDAVILSSFTPSAMLFVRCRDGISHHPDEFVALNDITLALTALLQFVQEVADSWMSEPPFPGVLP